MATFSLINFLNEARRRRVFRVAALYIVAAWITLQAADLAFPGLGIPESAIRYVWLAAIVGLPIARIAKRAASSNRDGAGQRAAVLPPGRRNKCLPNR